MKLPRPLLLLPTAWRAGLLALVLGGGCADAPAARVQTVLGGGATTAGVPAPAGSGQSTAPNSLQLASIASLEGAVRGPVGLVANNSASLVGNGAAGLVANGAGGLVANSAGGLVSRRRVQSAFPEEAVSGALVYLATPAGQFVTDASGRILSAVTDAQGRFSLAEVPSQGLALVQVMLSRQRRLVGYLRLAAGRQVVEVDMATTLVTETLREHARLRGVDFADLAPPRVDDLVARTRVLLAEGRFGAIDIGRDDPDLSIPGIPALVNRYLAMAARDSALAGAWAGVLGYVPLALDPAPGDFLADARVKGYQPHALAWDAARGRMALGLRGQADTRIVVWQPGADTLPRTVEAATLHGDGGVGLRLSNPDAMVWMASGSLWVADGNQAIFRPEGLPTYLLRIDGPDRVFRLFLQAPEGGQVGEIWGAALAPDGSLWISDATRGVLRRIAAVDLFPAVTSDGVGIASAPAMVGQLDTSGLAEGSPADARFDFPMGLVFSGSDLLVADRQNHRVRRVVGAGSGAPVRVVTEVGGGASGSGRGSLGLFADEGLSPDQAVLRHPDQLALGPDGRLVVSMEDRVVAVVDGRVRTLVTSAWGAFPSGEARRVFTDERLGLVFVGSGLWLSATDGPGVSRLTGVWP